MPSPTPVPLHARIASKNFSGGARLVRVVAHRRRHAPTVAIVCAVVFSLTSMALGATPGRPLSCAYEPAAGFVKGDVRSVAEASDGAVIVGSNVLAAFDGTTWQTIAVPEAYAFRALSSVAGSPTGRVWVGAIGAIGFIEPDAAGRWRYVSLLRDLSRAGLAGVGDVWGVQALGNGAVWVTDSRVIRWKPATGVPGGEEKLDVWTLEGKSHLTLFAAQDAVIIHQHGTGLLKLRIEGAPELLVPEANLPASPVTWLVSGLANTTMIGLGDTAWRLEANQTLTPLKALTNALHDAVPTAAVRLDSQHLAIGTFGAGVVFADASGEILTRSSAAPALLDASVYSLAVTDGHVWVASRTGVTRLDAPTQQTWYSRSEALHGGKVVRVLAHEGREFVLATTGLFVAEPAGAGRAPWLELIQDAPGTFTGATIIDRNLWVAALGGLSRLHDGTLVQEYFGKADISVLTKSARLERGILFIEGYSLKALVPGPRGDWIARDLGFTVPDSPVSLLEDDTGDVWVSTMTRGVLRLGWDAAGATLTVRKHFARTGGLPSAGGRVELTRINGRVIALTDAGPLVLSSDRTEFSPMPGAEAYVAIAAAAATRDSAFWLVEPRTFAGEGMIGVVRAELAAHGPIEVRPINIAGIDECGAVSMLDTTDGPDGTVLWLGSARGLLRIRTSDLVPAPAPPGTVLGVASVDPQGRTFTFARSPTSEARAAFYQSRLDGVDDDWTITRGEHTRRFSALAPAAYRFHARAVDHFGRPGAASEYRFEVAQPKWRSPGALAVYALLSATTIAGIARWRITRLQALNRRLNQLVADRTREIELGSTAKSDFLENISHEIRNPLNGLRGLLGLLKEEKLDPQEREVARSLKSVAATLTQVFEDVLQFSKLEYGYGKLDVKPFSVREVVDEIVRVFEIQSAQAGCPIQVRWPDNFADGFRGDREKIKCVVANFVSNALKYAPGTPIEIRVVGTGETAGLVDLYIDVIDGGSGVPGHEQELIFKKFVRGHRAQATGAPGTGLGLATCSALAKLMNGSVGVESTPGKGATFSLKLLVARASLSNSNVSHADVSAAAACLPDEYFLIVDDEPYNRTILQEIARGLGARSDAVGTVREAIEHAARRDYTALLLDWELPDGTGECVAREVTARRSARATILATTAHDSEEIRQRCLAAGMTGFVLKPYNANRVRDALMTARAKTSARGGAGEGLHPHHVGDSGLDLTAFELYAKARNFDVESARQEFNRAMQDQQQAISAAAAHGDWTEVARCAHRVRGLAGMIGASSLNRMAAELEKLARDGDAAQRVSAVQALDRAIVTSTAVPTRGSHPPSAA